MVRKRSRTGTKRKSSIKFDDSDENESETELDSDSASPSPAPKRYGLRQRKQTVFFDDFDCEDEEDLLNTVKHRSDDEEYDVRNDLRSKENQSLRPRSRRRTSGPQSSAVLVTAGPTTEVALENGLIDFEDVIRADVVINQQKAGQKQHHNKAEETNKLEAESVETPTYVVEQVVKRGRGRPRKTVQKTIIPVASKPIDNKKEERRTTTASDEDSTKVEVQLDPLDFVRSNLDEHNAQAQSNGVHSITNVQSLAKQSTAKNASACSNENGSVQKPASINSIEKYVPPELDEKEKEVILSNEYLLGNSFDMSADEFLQKQAQKSTEEETDEEDNVPLINFNDDDSDDDVVIIEKKPEIIVLDDD